MNVLAFDTCLGAVSAAVRWRVAGGAWQAAERFEVRAGGHAERLMPMVAEVMGEAALAFSALDRIAVTVGPGSFTGVRVGVAAARGRALASGLPVVAASSLSVMARGAAELLAAEGDGRLLVVAVDAHKGMIYAELFEQAQGEAGQPALLAPGEVAALIGARAAIVVGSGADAVCRAVAAAGGQAEARLPDLQPHARALTLMATDLAPVASLRPLYLRPPDVKPQADKSLARAAP